MSLQPIHKDPGTKGHILALDGLRGLAILMVLCSHISERFQCEGFLWTTFRNVAFGGWTGVDLFFVLSGFLITGILWDTRESAHYFRNFYMRRTLRIFPLNYAAMTFLFFVLPLIASAITSVFKDWQGGIQGVADQMFLAGATYWPLFYSYLVNVLVAWKGFNIAMTHLWSLSVEEHFYLAWPLLVHRLKLRTLLITSVTLIVAALVLRIVAVPKINQLAIYVLTPFRMDGLALGALLALLWRLPDYKVKAERWARVVLPLAGLLLLAIFLRRGTGSQYGRWSQTLGYTVSVLFYGALLVRALGTEWVNAIFRFRFLRFFGKYSYSIYIFHVLPVYMAAPLFALGDKTHFSLPTRVLELLTGRSSSSISGLPLSVPLLWIDGFAYILLVPAVSVGIAIMTWHLLEAPCLRLKRFFSYAKDGKPMEGAKLITELARS